MNRKEFCEKITSYYDDFTEKNTLPRLEAYCIVLDEIEEYLKKKYDELDYDWLIKEILKNHENFRFAPAPAVLFKLVKEKKSNEYNPYL
ncbi:MAG: hypothetical protein IKU37_08870 [Candidatus Gastranaerophilales bacterium]|nr:hypothetical protein [Candidatus Gastranaerophilales bacterium]